MQTACHCGFADLNHADDPRINYGEKQKVLAHEVHLQPKLFESDLGDFLPVQIHCSVELRRCEALDRLADVL